MWDKIGNGIGVAMRAVLIAAVIAPSLGMNIWPKLSLILDGEGDAYAVVMVLLAAVAVALMAGTVIAYRKADTIGAKAICLLMGTMLMVLNLGNATEVASSFRDAKAEPRRDLIEKAATLKSRIESAAKSRAVMATVPAVSADSVEAAKTAAKAATANKTQECGKLGDNCRQRMIDENNAQATLQKAMADKAAYDTIVKADNELAQMRSDLEALGTIPAHADPFAVRFAKVLSIFTSAASLVKHVDPPSADQVSEWWPTFIGFIVEVIAMFGPMIVLMLFAAEPAPVRIDDAAKPETTKRQRFVRNPKKPARPPVTSLPDKQSVVEWRSAATTDRDGASVRCGVAYENYVQWCREQKKEPLTLTSFGYTMRDLGVKSTELNKRKFYNGLVLSSGPRLVAVAS